MIDVLLVDDQQLLRHSLAIIINAAPDMTVVGEAGDGSEAVTLARQLRPDVVLMDIRMPGQDGIVTTRQISQELTGTRVLVLTMFELDEYVYGALRAGASGFLLKDTNPDDLLAMVRRTHAGESLFAPAILTRLVEHYLATPRHQPPRPDGLTQREAEILTHIGRGLSNDEIATALTISVKTVKTHISRLLSKLAARDRAQLVIAAYELGLVTPRN
ncbi:response regulator [Kibdelosporangium aridum]|uniref:DNA-binding response regulator, NarL/FixJ family, contains REC and HTH domains n=1 Tax=Kibdelosporangium aridum TaxID=2030 RepID=A0A1W2FBE9_KIBAR|nr:response regulator transcription factor [Kibdelosporangium aridum]SMD18876.1 DNA-binding response regulator, NarL/FixJ family, contains REC and HTH domains [Kibdelosporangium aridum]